MNNNLGHIALILDGNKRWSKNNKLNNLQGYNKGFENILEIVNFSLDIGISDLTLFALSSENFNRSTVRLIYEIIYNNFNNLLDKLIKQKKIKIKIFGSRNNLPSKIVSIFEDAEKLSSNNKALNLNIAFNYGFKNEIKNILKKINNNKLKIDLDNDDNIRNLFSLGLSSDPDLLIRTGGHKRLSNFIMYNLTYTELFFTETLWPDFTIEELKKIIEYYQKIDRKYGL